MRRTVRRWAIGLLTGAIGLTGLAQPAGAATPKCFGAKATIVGTNEPNELVGTNGSDVIVGLGGDDEIYGKGGADRICGGGAADYLDGGLGTDRIRGQGGDDSLVGRGGHDVLSGLAGQDFLFGMNGSDQYIGGPGFDFSLFAFAAGPVSVDLAAGSASGEGSETLQGIEGVLGSDYQDTIRGDGVLNVLAGGLGNDGIDGRGDSDHVLYGLAAASVTVNLTDGTATGGEGSDTLSSIENAFGTEYNDTLIGSAGPNYLIGWEGNDTVDGRGGDDVCVGETLLNCPLPPDDPSDEPPTETDPPTQSGAPRGLRVLDAPRPEKGGWAAGASRLRSLDDFRTLWVTWNDSGSHSCWGGQTTAFPPIVSASGWVSWRPVFLYYSPFTGYKYFYGSWVHQYRHTGLLSPQFLAIQGYADAWVTVWHQVYDWDTGQYSQRLSPWFFRNPVFGYQNSGQVWCPEGRE